MVFPESFPPTAELTNITSERATQVINAKGSSRTPANAAKEKIHVGPVKRIPAIKSLFRFTYVATAESTDASSDPIAPYNTKVIEDVANQKDPSI